MRKLIFLFLLLPSFTSYAQNNWQYLPDTGLTTGSSRYEDVYFTDTTTGYAVTYDGNIFKTKDAGRNWTNVLSKPRVSAFRSIEFLDDKLTGIAGTLDSGSSHYRTDDGGNTWTNIGSSIHDTITPKARYICGIAHNGNTFYAVGAWSSRRANLYKSTDKGLTWTTHYLDPLLISSAVDVCFTSADTGFITGGAGTGVASYSSVVIKTTDGGQTWARVFSDVSIGGRIWKIQAITSKILVGSIEPFNYDTVAMIKSTDGGNNWSILGTGFRRHGTVNSFGTQGIGFINPRHGWLGGWYDGIFETKDGGQTWDSLNFGSNFNRCFVLDSSHVFAGGAEIYFYGGQIPEPVAVRRNAPLALPHTLYPVTPNPAGNRVKIEFDLHNGTYVLLQVAATDAKRSWELASGWMPKGHYVYYWDGSNAPRGNYIVWLGTNEIPVVEKFTLR